MEARRSTPSAGGAASELLVAIQTLTEQVARLVESNQLLIRSRVFDGPSRRGEAPVPTISVSELLARYREYSKPPAKAESTWATEGIHLGHVERFLRRTRRWSRAATEMAGDVIEDYKRFRVAERRDGRRGRVGPVTVNKELDTIRNVFTFAVETGLLHQEAVIRIRKFHRVGVEQPAFMTGAEIEDRIRRGTYTSEQQRALRRARILTWAEVAELLEVVQGTFSFIPVAIAAYTGARRGEITRLIWPDVMLDGRRPELILRSRKQSRSTRETSRRIGLVPRLRTILEALREEGDVGYLFPGEMPGTSIAPAILSGRLERTLETTDFALVRYHNLRHSFESNLARAGVDQREINELMGHTNAETARRYRHLFPDQRSRWLETVR